MGELNIGTVLPYKGKLYKIVKGESCAECDATKNNQCDVFATKYNWKCSKCDRSDKTSIKYLELMKNTEDMNEDSHRTIGDMTIRIEEGVSCADCCFCNVCHANGAGAKNDFYFYVSDYFGACASDKRKDGKSIVFTIEGKNMLYIPFTGRLERGVSGANTNHTSSTSNTLQILHPRVDNNKCYNVQVVAPNGYIIDVENSDITKGIIKFKSTYLTYADIIDSLFLSHNIEDNITIKDTALHKLQNIADYYNGDWKPNWKNVAEIKYYITYNYARDTYKIVDYTNLNFGLPVFKNIDDVQSVIDNPNFRDILDNIFGNY